MPRETKPPAVVAKPGLSEDGQSFHLAEEKAPKLKVMGGSNSDAFNLHLINSAWWSQWSPKGRPDYDDKVRTAVAAAMGGISPKNELEGMLAAQLVASHAAAMECYRRAMIEGQTFQGRCENLNQANRLSRTYATLLEALNRHRGKGQQKVTVEHVHVYEGGQAVVGAVQTGGGAPLDNQGQPHAKPVAHAPLAPMRSEDPTRNVVPIAGPEKRALPHARRKVAGGS